MISFFLSFYRFMKILIKGLKEDEEFRALFIFIVFLLIGAILFYTKIEHWSVIDALYFSVMTMSTVGYGDLVPSTNISKIFTIIYTFLSISTFVAFTAKLLKLIFENKKIRTQKIKKRFNKFKTRNEN